MVWVKYPIDLGCSRQLHWKDTYFFSTLLGIFWGIVGDNARESFREYWTATLRCGLETNGRRCLPNLPQWMAIMQACVHTEHLMSMRLPCLCMYQQPCNLPVTRDGLLSHAFLLPVPSASAPFLSSLLPFLSGSHHARKLYLSYAKSLIAQIPSRSHPRPLGARPQAWLRLLGLG